MKQNRIGFYISSICLVVLVYVLLQALGFCFWKNRQFIGRISWNASSVIRYQYLDIQNSSKYHPMSELDHIQENIMKTNEYQIIQNDKQFGPLEDESVVIVIQMHKRLGYLKRLIESLSVAENISSALLVISHDYYNDKINDYVQSIEFCKVIQIFYPYSLQTHPYIFPGTDPRDCPKKISKLQALIKNCTNALHPDHFGNYREAKFTQTKHHWWWKLHRIFDELEVTRNHTGLKLFLEEDHYVAEDFLHVLNLMQTSSIKLCPRCKILCLGRYLHKFQLKTYRNWTDCLPFNGGLNNMGMAFNRSTWLSIKSCARAFCTFDDYNWDWSLTHVASNCLKDRLIVLSIMGPRVFHVGACGVHHKSADCKSTKTVAEVRKLLRAARESGRLFPSSLARTTVKKKNYGNILPKINGGWADPRDHQMCLSMPHRVTN